MILFWQNHLLLLTLRPSRTLLFSGLPMIIWQKNKFLQYPLSKTAEKFVNWQQFKAALFDLREKKCACRIKPSDWCGGQTHGYILLKKNLYYISFYFIFCRLSPFHREWPQLATILTSFDLSFGTKFKSSTFESNQAIHGESNLTCKESNKNCIIEKKNEQDPSMRLASRLIWRFWRHFLKLIP